MILSKAPLRLAVQAVSLIVSLLILAVLTIQFHRLLVIIESKVILENCESLVEFKKHEFRSYRVLFTVVLYALCISLPLLIVSAYQTQKLTSKFLN